MLFFSFFNEVSEYFKVIIKHEHKKNVIESIINDPDIPIIEIISGAEAIPIS
ncbi:hypothetical protein CNEO_60062 [Clostridium neonatale]|uniref:Uncharacterized protein n=1 Tax=Clostridium neonatale TaxID=137838 RepID=A0AA86MPZ6_9CLOT|nr:hypothetical protein CNEO_60062 [Clostridium neonatale]